LIVTFDQNFARSAAELPISAACRLLGLGVGGTASPSKGDGSGILSVFGHKFMFRIKPER